MAGSSCEESNMKREREKEKTRLRERKRRSITTKILDGLRKHGGYDLPSRPDINDVLRALAAEAGWTVLADGTTYRNNDTIRTRYDTMHHPNPQESRHVSQSSNSAFLGIGEPLPCRAGPTCQRLSYMATGGARFATSGPMVYVVPDPYCEEPTGKSDYM